MRHVVKVLASASVAAIFAVSLSACGGGGQAQQSDAGSTTVEKEPEVEEKPTVEEVKAEPNPYIKESTWRCDDNQIDGTKYVQADYVIGCGDPTNCYVMMKVQITAKSSDGTVLATDTDYVTFVAPNDIMPCSHVLTTAEEPAEVTFDLSYDQGQKPGNDYTLADLPVANQTVSEVNGYTKWTGEYTNQTGVDFERGCDAYVVLRKDGKLVAIFNGHGTGDAANGSTHPFEISSYSGSVPEHDSYEVYIVPNLI